MTTVQPVLLLDQNLIDKKLQRMAYEIWERTSDQKEITIIGIRNGGYSIAQKLAEILRVISPLEIFLASLHLNKKNPNSEPIELDQPLTTTCCVLVDDVANTGKTLMHAFAPLLHYKPELILLAVLVDRSHKSFPIRPDIVGHCLSTTLLDRVEVEIENQEIKAAYLI